MKKETKVFTVVVEFGWDTQEVLKEREKAGLYYTEEEIDEIMEGILEEYEFDDLQARMVGMLQKEFSRHNFTVRYADIKTIL